MGPFMMEAQKLGYLLNMNTDLKLNTPQLEIQIDRDRASALGVSVTDIGTTLQTLLGGSEVTRFKRGNKQYEVMLQVRPQERSSPAAIDGLYLRGRDGLVQMASVVKVQEKVAPKELNHFDRVRSATLSANLPPGAHGRQGHRGPERDRQAHAAAGHAHRSRRRIARVRRVERRALLAVRHRTGVHLPGTGRPVRELRPPALDPVLRAARGVRRPADVVRVPECRSTSTPRSASSC